MLCTTNNLVGSAALLNKLSEELIVSSNEIRLLDCIGQGYIHQ